MAVVVVVRVSVGARKEVLSLVPPFLLSKRALCRVPSSRQDLSVARRLQHIFMHYITRRHHTLAWRLSSVLAQPQLSRYNTVLCYYCPALHFSRVDRFMGRCLGAAM
ncbi:hypothetical protein E2C01_055190 [Portunus trituberculatus]|uniref:Uncharacterized protein n=1 Tax=Portunus trituberculatus TaxID=210409 RepID=A0A5B7GU60_PORTR|nr:hypothetical protein [Portunus trituberculatus]